MPDERLRVVVDGLTLTDGSRLRGLGTTLRHLLAGLADSPTLDLVVLAREAGAVPAGSTLQPLRRHDVRPKLALLEHEWRTPGDLRRARPDVVWSPANHPPRRASAPVVQTLHDLTPLVRPSAETAHEAARWRRCADRVRQAARVVAVSRSSATQAVDLLGVDPARVEVVHNGVDPWFTPGARASDDPPYLLFVAAWGPHKGHAEAFAVIAALAEAGYPHTLYVAGPNDAWMQARVEAALRAAPRPERVNVLGYVDDLVDLYRGASALIVTSRAEGFGLPIAEAMACGTPVVAFSNTSIPEVAGEAAAVVPDGDVEAFVRATRVVLDDHAFAAELRASGLEQAAQFRWENAVARYEEIFRSVRTR